MAVRYASTKVLDYCFHPLKVLKDGEYIFVPCNKCDGCRLHKANLWSNRVSTEIEHNPFSIFFTLTYNNHYLPTLIAIPDQGTPTFTYISNHPDNIRFNGDHDVFREDNIVISGNYFVPIQNDNRKFTINYASKRDIQLWLKLLRKSIDDNLVLYGKDAFRYYIISEKGPTTHRWHFHGLLFPKNREIAEFLIETAMFENWKMCDWFLFREHTTYCDSGTAMYVSNYTTCINKLPQIYQKAEVRPFRLSSKSPAIGYSLFDKTFIFKEVERGVITYSRTVDRIGKNYILCFPSNYISSIFPKCYQFSLLSFERLLWIYGTLYREIVGYGRPYTMVSQQLRSTMHSSDFEATKKCFDWCQELGCTPFHYVYVLDLCYYKYSMAALSRWYSWQSFSSSLSILKSYSNLSDYVSCKGSLSSYQLMRIRLFCESFGVVFDDLDYDALISLSEKSSDQLNYELQVSDIVDHLDKIPKFNEMIGNSPHII